MKKLLLILLGGLLLTIQSQAQTYLTEHSDSVTSYWTGGPDPMEVHNNIKSASGSPIKVRWRLLSSYFAPGWSLSGFCDNNVCYGSAGVLAGTPFVSNNYYNTSYSTSTATDVHTFDAQFTGMAAAANGSVAWVRLIIKDEADTTIIANHRTLTFIGVKNATGVSSVSVSDDNVVVFPNPAREAVNVIFDENSGVRSVGVYSLIGRVVKIYKTAGNSARVELNEVPAGVYFLRLMNAQGQVVATRRFNHQ